MNKENDINHISKPSCGAMADTSFDLHRRIFLKLGFVNFCIYAVMALLVTLLIWLGFVQAMPHFSLLFDNAALAGTVIAIALGVIISFFIILWSNINAAALLHLCNIEGSSFWEDVKVCLMRLLRTLPLALSLSLAQFLLFIPLGSVLVLFILSGVFIAIPLMVYVLVGIAFFVIKGLGMFSMASAMFEGRHFYSPMLQSSKAVVKRHLISGPLCSLFYSLINAAIFFLFLLVIHGQVPSMASVFTEPAAFAVAVGLSALPMLLVGPKLQVLAYVLYKPRESNKPRRAKLPSRAIAAFTDTIICLAVFLASSFGLFYFYGLDMRIAYAGVEAAAIAGSAFFLFCLVYNVYFEVYERGATLGKRLMGLEVVSHIGRLSLLQSLIRNILKLPDILLCPIFVISKSEHLRLGDMLSQTSIKTK